MGAIYDRTDTYDLGFDERKHNIVKQHWQILLAEKNIKSILDCSIGSGNLALPPTELGYNVGGYLYFDLRNWDKICIPL